MNLSEILKRANFDVSLDQLLAGVSDDSLHRITCNVLDISNDAMETLSERIDALKTVRDSLNDTNGRLIAQRDKAHIECAQLRTDLSSEKGLADILETERDELRAALGRREHHLGAVRRTKADLDLCKQTLDVLRQEYDKLVIERVKKQADLSAALSTIATLRAYGLIDEDRRMLRKERDEFKMQRDLMREERIAVSEALDHSHNRINRKLRDERDKLRVEHNALRVNLASVNDALDERHERVRQLSDELDDKDAVLERVGRDCDTLRSEYDKINKLLDAQQERSRAIGNRLATELKNDPNTATWLSILGLVDVADVDDSINRDQKITALKIVREATGCGLIEAKKAVETREAAGFMETGEALEIVHIMAKRDLKADPINRSEDQHARLVLALGTVEDFIANNFSEED